jgi:hypothetical protein
MPSHYYYCCTASSVREKANIIINSASKGNVTKTHAKDKHHHPEKENL